MGIRKLLVILVFMSLFMPLFLASSAGAEELPLSGNCTVKLQEPHFSNGVLTTEKGGIVSGKDFFLQAQVISYTRTSIDGEDVHRLEARGDLFLQFNGKPFTGKRVEIDFIARTATIYDGYTTVDSWFVGGKEIKLHGDGSGEMHDGYFTTSENADDEWEARSKQVQLLQDATISADNVRFYFMDLPFLWIPTLTFNLKDQSKLPFACRFRWGGNAGARVEISYDLIKSKTYKGQVLLDIGLTRGLGAGFVGNYSNPNGIESAYTYNYAAKDLTEQEHPRSGRQPLRYRFQGKYVNQYGTAYLDDAVRFKLTYDKISDANMRYDYANKTLESINILPTQAQFSHKSDNYISTLNTKVKVNDFQTIKQELPLFTFNARPMQLGKLGDNSGPILDNRFSAGYLNYNYGRNTDHVHNFQSSRLELSQMLYKQFHASGLVLTPHMGYSLISYNTSPQAKARLQGIGKAGFDSHVRFTRPFGDGSHALEPYVNYDFLTTPLVNPNDHYLFDLQDGWHRLNMFKIGAVNSFVYRDPTDSFLKRFNFDLYTRAFIRTKTEPTIFPKMYLDAAIKPTAFTAYKAEFAYDFRNRLVDHVNLKGDFTVSEDLAFSLEWRHRSEYAWRKVDPDNFIIDSYRTQHRLKRSPLSDRRNTFLTHIFYSITPTFSLDLHTRHGWHRKHQPSYFEYGIEAWTLIKGALHLTFSYDHRHSYNRYAISFNLGAARSASDHKFNRFGYGNYDN